MAVVATRIDPLSAAFSKNAAHYEILLQTLRNKVSAALRCGGEEQVRRHRARRKMLARDRIDLLIDPASPFLELSPLAATGLYEGGVPAAGIVTGIGVIEGVRCMIIANDATVKGGSFFPQTVKKHLRAQEIAADNRLPVIYLVDCGGAYLPEQDRVFPDKDHFGTTFYRQCQMSAAGIPQIAAVFGGCTAGGAYIPALCDEVVMVRNAARIHLGGPSIVKAAVGETVDAESLGGAEMHTFVSGVNDYLAEDERQAIGKVRDVVAGFNWPRPSVAATHPVCEPIFAAAEIGGIIGKNPKTPYDIREIIMRLVDGSDMKEFKPQWGETLVCITAHIHGHPVGILANNGALFAESSLKGTHFIEICNQRQIPLLFLQNISGFIVGSEAERGGIAKHGAKLVYAMSTARVPRLTLIIGGSYGAGNYGMCGRGFNPSFLFTWPTARIATMSPEVATMVLTDLRRSSIGRDGAAEAELADIAAQTTEQFTEQSDPYYATARLWDDGIIEPEDTRDVLGLCLAIVAGREPVKGTSPVYRM